MTEKTMRQIENLKNQTIGVEVEMNSITRKNAAKVAAEYFGTGRFEDTARRNGYRTWSAWDADGREWKFQRDVSIHGPEDEKCELVTPILHYSDIETLQELCRRLRKAGAKSDADRGCGVHIHIGANGHTPKSLEAGGMQQLLAELNREKYDYEAFLKKFAVMGEVMKINDDEFDYIFYTYGLKLFKNMPLIEPLEYKEVRRVREFVIAIDTSGSTSGELVNRFLTKTYNILMSTESFFSKVNIHIIQCDAQVQEVVKITKREEFEDYLKHMTIRGLGGTDFQPVFAYVDQLVKQREFQHLNLCLRACNLTRAL